jgi:hypothetical protein
MPYAGYLLNPGDMFQVDPDSVLFATGAPKQAEQIQLGKKMRSKYRRVNKGIRIGKAPRKRNIMKVVQASLGTEEIPAAETTWSIAEVRSQRQLEFRDIYNQLQISLQKNKKYMGVKRKQEYRALAKDVRNARARINTKTEQELNDLLEDFKSRSSMGKKVVPEENEQAQEERVTNRAREISEDEKKNLEKAIIRARENPVDASKPYATPWRPRPYMSAFAFVPRYLEVNHNICSAVYLRHPVARTGLAEVPSPFGGTAQQLAFNWYLRRR